MKFNKVSLENKGIVNSLVWDYLQNSSILEPFILDFPSEASINDYLKEERFKYLDRDLLSNEIFRQYDKINLCDEVRNNINDLSKKNSYTICTGHQLCLFTGPAYFFYKIVSVIKQAKNLNNKFPEKKFVPVFWMATEDHDFEEINHTFLFGKKIVWETNQRGRVGEFNLHGLESLLNQFKEILGDTDVSRYVNEIFSTAIKNSVTLVEFTRHFLNEIFGKYGLVVVDGNSAEFKSLFVDEMQAELFENNGWKCVSEYNKKLESLGYSAQVSPREINLFYCEKGLRERIVRDEGEFKVLNTDLIFSASEIKKLVREYPEKFSPNVVLRPLYQQKILPNLFYVGGPAEISYWLQLKSFFDASEIHFPYLEVRDFVCVLESKIVDKWMNLGFDISDFFRSEEELKNQWLKNNSEDISLEEFQPKAIELFDGIKFLAEKSDPTLIGSVEAEKQRLLNAFLGLEKKMIRFAKQKNESSLNQISKLQSKVFPDGVFQERKENFFALINNCDSKILDELLKGKVEDANFINFLIC